MPKEKTIKYTFHGHAGKKRTRIYAIWQNMRQRCLNPNCPVYCNYGGRGIKISPEWSSFLTFLEDMGKTYSDDLTIERINNNGNYEIKNCKWIPLNQQLRNTRKAHLHTLYGKTQTENEWAKEYGLSQGVLSYRLRKGIKLSEALAK